MPIERPFSDGPAAPEAHHAEQRFAELHRQQENAHTQHELLAVLRAYDAFIREFPNAAEAYLNRSNVFQSLGLYQSALQDAREAVRLAPENALAWCHYAFVCNLLGDYREGWKAFEWRWKTDIPSFRPSGLPCPRWQGQDIGQDRLFVYSEQGLGDNIQFVRFALELKRRGFNIAVMNYVDVENVINYNLRRHGIETVRNNTPMSIPQYHVTMMSLPYLLGIETGNIPFSDGYLQAEPPFIEKWRAKLAAMPSEKHGKAKIGLVWAGSPKHARNRSRSTTLQDFVPLLSADAEFHCLQKEISAADYQTAQNFDNLSVHHQDLHDFSDTAALIGEMDLVVSVDTSVAHMAAAMGKPTWILLSFHPDYRWLTERRDSPWYASARLFRQDASLKWHGVFQELERELSVFCRSVSR